MGNVALIDRGDHWEVIGDYSRSPKMAALTENEWKQQFAGSEFKDMRDSHPGVSAADAPKGVGKWLKDWSGPYLKPNKKLSIASDASLDFDDVPVVGAGGIHQILIESPVARDSSVLRILSSVPLPLSESEPALLDGAVTISVGPSLHPCDATLTAVDPAGALEKTSLHLRFR